jgi:hypothetical protein
MAAENPYKPPAATVRDPPRPPRAPRSPVVGVLTGLAIDVGGTIVAGIVLGIVYAVVLAARGMGPEQIQTTLTDVDPSSGFFLLSGVVGLGLSVLGGYVCARMVRRDERRLAAIMGGLSAASGVALGAVTLVTWLSVGLLVVSFAAVMAGGELGRRRNVADARNADSGVATAA